MKKTTVFKRIAAGFGVVIVVLTTLLLGATWYVNQEPFQKKIHAMVAERAGNTFTFQKLRLSLFPRPCVIVFDPVVNVPDRISVTMQSARIYPEVLPLLSGTIRIKKLGIFKPEIIVMLAEEPGSKTEDPAVVFEEARAEIRSALDTVQDIAPSFFAEIAEGHLAVMRDQTALLRMSGISGTIGLLPHGFSLQLRGDAQRWGPVSVNGSLYAWRNSISLKDVTVAGGRSSIAGLSANFRWKNSPYLNVRSAQAVFSLGDLQERRHLLGELNAALKDVKDMTGTIRIASFSFIGPLLHSEQWKLNTTGSVQNIEVQSGLFPGPVSIKSGAFTATMTSFSVTATDAGFLDSTITTTASVMGTPASPRAIDLMLQGRIGQEAIHWAAKKFDLPQDLIVRAPCTIPHLRIIWKNNGSLALVGTASLGKGPRLSIDMRRNPKEFRIKRLEVRDAKNTAVLAFRRTESEFGFSFRGNLTGDTVNRIFERTSGKLGWITGDFDLHLMFQKPEDSTARGLIAANHIVLPFKALPLSIRNLDIKAQGDELTVNSTSFVWAGIPLEATGRLTARNEGFRVNANLSAKDLDMDRIEQLLGRHGNEEEKKEGGDFSRLEFLGTIRLSVSSFKWGPYTFKPAAADIFLDRNGVRLQILDARLCGLSLSGLVQPLDNGVLLDLEPLARLQPLGPFIDCFTENKRIDGTFGVAGRIHGRGSGRELMSSLNGSIDFAAENGKIHTYPLLARVFAFLNVTELLHGTLPDMGKDGFAYRSIRIKGDLRNGKLLLREAIVEGTTLNLVAEGEIDFVTDKIDVTILVAPFKTVEYILSKIPLIRNVLANKLVTVPVRVTGDRNNPEVIPLEPVSIGEHLLDLMTGILELPFKVLSPLFTTNEKK